jgi:hypothetical protein
MPSAGWPTMRADRAAMPKLTAADGGGTDQPN